MIRATIAKNAKRKAKHKSTLGELAKHDHADVATYGDEIPDTSRHRQTYKCDIKDSTARSVITGFKTGAAGNDEYHNNLAPIIGCYAWRRQA